jgi:HPr kinase/phosphorylase
MKIIHSTCVSLNGLGVLIRGASGSGKSDLALQLIDQGATLVADDYCLIHLSKDQVIATCPSNIQGAIEMRGYGIIKLPFEPVIRVFLLVDLLNAEAIPRLPEKPFIYFEGVNLSHLMVDPKTNSAANKIRLIAAEIGQRDYKIRDVLPV